MPHLKITNMNKLLSFTVLILLFVSCETIQKSDKEDIHETNLSNYINKWLEQTGIPSASYIIVKNGKIQEAEAFGYANLKKRTPVDTSSIYSTGSNFKSVTSTAIMQLQAKGLIDIDSSVNKYFKTPIPNIDPKNPVTARQLMSHTSGIPSSISIYKLWERKPELTLRDIKKNISFTAKPGEKFQYANDGYVLLAILIEDITGQSYEDYIWKNILKPLGIQTIGFFVPTPEMVENLALPYHIRYNKAYPTNQIHIAQYPAGDIFLKPSDMAKFLLMQLNMGTYDRKTILSKESVLEMHKPEIEVEKNFYYGFGFGIEKYNGETYSTHQGSLSGYLSIFRMSLDKQTAVYISTNVGATPLQEKQIQTLLDFLTDYANGDELKEKKIPVSEETIPENSENIDIKKYVGKYKIENAPVYLIIEKVGNQLYLINPSNERFRIDYRDNNNFFLTTENEDITFEEQNGQISTLILHSEGNDIKAKKE